MVLCLLHPNSDNSKESQSIFKNPITFQKISLENYIICIDPSGGGSDPGATTSNGVTEKELTLDIATRLRQLIVEDGGIAFLTRVGDFDVTNYTRKEIANNGVPGPIGGPADIFISIRSSFSSDPQEGGIGAFHYPSSTDGIKLAGSIVNQLVNALHFENKSITPQDSYLTQKTTMPANLVMVGYLSNLTESSLLARSEIRQLAAEAILFGIQEYFNVTVHLPQPRYYTNVVFATREGLVGGTTSNGHTIIENDTFVALPSWKVDCPNDLNYDFMVNLTYQGRSAAAPVWDVGPWNIADEYWGTKRTYTTYNNLVWGIPESQAAYINNYNGGNDQFNRTVLNPAGIDLADGTFWNNLSMTSNDWVKVEYLWLENSYLNNYTSQDSLVNGRNHTKFTFNLSRPATFSLTDTANPVIIDLIINSRLNISRGVFTTNTSLIQKVELWPYNNTATIIKFYLLPQYLAIDGFYNASIVGNQVLLDVYQPYNVFSYRYDRTAVVNYADEYWLDYNTDDYNDYSGGGGDCANYVSQCLIAGGLNLWQGRYGGGENVDSKGTMPFCDYLHQHLTTFQNVTHVTIDTSGSPPDWLEPGDVIIYGDPPGGDEWRHAVIVVEGTGDNAKINGHSSSRYHTNWDYAFGLGAYFEWANFYHIPDEIQTEFFTFEVNTSVLNVRHGPSTSYNDLGDLHIGERYVGFETEGSWIHFWYDHRNLWAYGGSDYAFNITGQAFFKVVSDIKVSVMTAASTSAGFLDYVYSGQKFCMLDRVFNESQEWIQFKYKGTNGWIPANKITLFDYIPPQYENLTQTPSPAEVGENITLSVDVTDTMGISQVLIEYESHTYPMEWIGGNTYQWSNWIPQSLMAYYRIQISDYSDNWNSTSYLPLNLQDTIPPNYDNLLESADPLQLGTSETIQIEVVDSGVGMDQVLLEYAGQNHTMTTGGGGIFSWSAWTPNSTGLKNYNIYMNDTAGNWNQTSDSINVISSSGPNWSNLIEMSDPLELGQNFSVYINVTDLQTSVSSVLFEVENQNYTMANINADTYHFSGWIPNSTDSFFYAIYMSDTESNWTSLSEVVLVQDTTPPHYSVLSATPSPLELGDFVAVQLHITDAPGTGIQEVTIYCNGANFSMSTIDGSNYSYAWQPTILGLQAYRIFIQDNSHNWNITYLFNLTVQDTRPPSLLQIKQFPSVISWGETVVLQVETSDSGGTGVAQVLLEYDGTNHTMIHTTGNYYIWDSWEVHQTSDITYRILMQDQNGNWKVTSYFSLVHGDPGFDWWWVLIAAIVGAGATAAAFLYRNRRKMQQDAATQRLKKGKAFLVNPLEKLQTVKADWRGFLRKYLGPDSKTVQLPLRSTLSPETIAVVKEEQNKAILEATKAIEAADIKAAIGYLEKAAKFAHDLGDTEQAQLVLTKIKEMKMILDILERRTRA